MAAAVRIEVPILAVRLVEVPTSSVIPAASPSAKGKKVEIEPASRAASSEPASQRSGKKKKAPTPEIEELEEEEESTTEDTNDSEEEEVPSTSLSDQKSKGRETRSSSKKKPGLVYRSPFVPKCQSKTPAKEEGSTKKPRGK